MDVPQKALRFETQEGMNNRRVIESRISELVKSLEDDEMGEIKTASTRGAIRALRGLLVGDMPHIATPRYSGLDYKRGNA